MKIGLITFHSAYNYGSVLQAYATQDFLQRNCGSTQIINYRMLEQKKIYSSFQLHKGWKAFTKDLLSLHLLRKKIVRKHKFEEFIKQYMNLSKEFSNPDQFANVASEYDVIISGSDQIWNKHANELHAVNWQYMEPYMLCDYNGRKISFASSIGNMVADDELTKLVEYIMTFEYISMREKRASDLLQSLFEQNICIETVLDPTFLLSKEEWISNLSLIDERKNKYLLFYSLASNKTLSRIRKLLYQFRDEGYEIFYITPYYYGQFLKGTGIVNVLECGPIEFMNYLYNASLVLTDSYHGTILSINLEKDFYSINGEYASDYRKTDILERLNLMDRSVGWDVEIGMFNKNHIRYDKVDEIKKNLISHSKDYLIGAIKNRT